MTALALADAAILALVTALAVGQMRARRHVGAHRLRRAHRTIPLKGLRR